MLGNMIKRGLMCRKKTYRAQQQTYSCRQGNLVYQGSKNKGGRVGNGFLCSETKKQAFIQTNLHHNKAALGILCQQFAEGMADVALL
jgi:hypothetical protein